MSLYKEFEDINSKINTLEFKPAGIFTNSLLHTIDTTQLIRDIRTDELSLFENRKISDIDYEVMNNIKDFEERLLENIRDPQPVDINLEFSENHSVDVQNDLRLVSIIEQRIIKLSELSHINKYKFNQNINNQIVELKSLLVQVKSTIEEVNVLNNSIKDKENE